MVVMQVDLVQAAVVPVGGGVPVVMENMAAVAAVQLLKVLPEPEVMAGRVLSLLVLSGGQSSLLIQAPLIRYLRE
jgi:hypothetical protein